MITDPISDMLTRIRNAYMVKKTKVALPFSKIKYAIAKILEKEGFVGSVSMSGEGIGKELIVEMKYSNNMPAIQKIRRVSTPGQRVYVKSTALPNVMYGTGMAIISTSNGLMTNKDAYKRKLGGEVICEVY